MSLALQLKPELLKRIESALSEPTYRDAIENSSQYNNRLIEERRTRLPFIDSQTGVAQNNCYLWMQRWERMPGKDEGQIYSYPARRWKKRRRGYLMNESCNRKCNDETDVDKDVDSSSVDQIVKSENNDAPGDKYDNSKDNWLSEYDDGEDLPDAGELDETSSDESFSEYMPRRNRKKKKEGTPAGRKRKQTQNQSAHHSQPATSQPQHSVPYSVSLLSSGPSSSRSTPVNEIPENQKSKDGRATPNKYCDFCLGDSEENRKTKSAERMVSCSDCGRSAHPTCLQFTPRMVMSIKKYRWQCIECKSCALCGTSDNDEQLLFCDDCDRGYHMYCLEPPLSEPPEGSWSCRLCIAEYHTPKRK